MTAIDVQQGTPIRIEGPLKVSGHARYAFEHPMDEMAYAWGVQSTIAKGQIRFLDTVAVLKMPGVLAVITPDNAPLLPGKDDAELTLFQSNDVAYRGQFVAAVVGTSLEVAREAAAHVKIEYVPAAHDVVLSSEHPRLYAPEHVNPRYETDTRFGDFAAAFDAAPVRVDHTYETPGEHNNPMEPHATVAWWDGDQLTLIDSNQGPSRVRTTIAALFGIDPSQVRVIAEHVGGGFGAKGLPRPSIALAAIAAKVVQRPVKFALTRQQMFAVVGYRTPTIQRVRLGADRDGRLTALAHNVFEQSSTLKEFAEQTALSTRHMYAAPNRETTHRLVRLDVPTPAWMRAPGECPGMYTLESAMDELAVACGVDPIELRVRNEPEIDPESGLPFSTRNLIACLREGADRFGWTPRSARTDQVEGRWMVGTGVAASTYPARAAASEAEASIDESGRYRVSIAASDIGTGARTALWSIAAEALDVGMDDVEVRIGDSAFGEAPLAGGSMGTASWSWAVIKACRELRSRLGSGSVPSGGLSVSVSTQEDIEALAARSRHAFGAQFAEARVDMDTGEVRIPRMLGVFAAGKIVNPRLARSQLIGGMTMGLSMALFEEGVMDREFGDYANHDLASYHIATCADVQDIEAVCLDEIEPTLGPAGVKGVGEIGIVGTAAAIANAVYDATGIRVRDLPIRLDKLLTRK